MPLTPKQQSEYLKNDTLCPYCGNDTFSSSDVRRQQGRVTQWVQCLECQRKWLDVYSLAAIEPID